VCQTKAVEHGLLAQIGLHHLLAEQRYERAAPGLTPEHDQRWQRVEQPLADLLQTNMDARIWK
jgi:hypothetical protein